jgi:hypothetical protein
MTLDFDIDDVLRKPLFAHLATSSLEGARESPVWFLWEGGALWLIGNAQDSYPMRIRRDPRCAVGIVDFDLDAGRLRHVGIRGVGKIEPLDQERLHRLLRRYLGPDRAAWNPDFRARIIDRLDLMIHIEPTSIVARDQSYFANSPAK